MIEVTQTFYSALKLHLQAYIACEPNKGYKVYMQGVSSWWHNVIYHTSFAKILLV